MGSLGKYFHRNFEQVRADTPLLLDEALQLRHRVYCLENDFEDASSFPDDREFDEYDLNSLHSIIRYKSCSTPVANARLVLPRQQNTESHFPIQKVVSDKELLNAAGFGANNYDEYAEISRFCISREIRLDKVKGIDHSAYKVNYGVRRGLSGESHGGDASFNLNEPSNNTSQPHIVIALFAAIFEMSAEANVKNWFAVMNPLLLRFLKRFGINFIPLGQLVDYHGVRQPCYANADEVALGIWQKSPELWEFVTDNGNVWPLPEHYKYKLAASG